MKKKRSTSKLIILLSLVLEGALLVFFASLSPTLDKENEELIQRLEGLIVPGLHRDDLEEILRDENIRFSYARKNRDTILEDGVIWEIPQSVAGYYYFYIGSQKAWGPYVLQNVRVFIDAKPGHT